MSEDSPKLNSQTNNRKNTYKLINLTNNLKKKKKKIIKQELDLYMGIRLQSGFFRTLDLMLDHNIMTCQGFSESVVLHKNKWVKP